MQRKINLTRVICLRMGKTYTAKTPPGDFQVTTPRIPLLSQQAITSKGILVPYTNLQLNPYPKTQLNLCCSDNFSQGLIVSLTMCLKALEHLPLASQFLRVSFTHGFLTDLVQPQFRKNCCNLVKSLDGTITFKPNFYYIVYDKLDVLSSSCNFKLCYTI